jgi:hypothetical protein
VRADERPQRVVLRRRPARRHRRACKTYKKPGRR